MVGPKPLPLPDMRADLLTFVDIVFVRHEGVVISIRKSNDGAKLCWSRSAMMGAALPVTVDHLQCLISKFSFRFDQIDRKPPHEESYQGANCIAQGFEYEYSSS